MPSSCPYCPYPAQPYAFGIVGVTGGRATSQNTYLAQQFVWAKAATGAPPALYMNLNAPIGRSATQARTSTPQSCKWGDKACQGYNYGWHVAQEAVAYASSQGASASLWWLDIETANSWLQANVNVATINGATAGLKAAGVSTVGIYSTPSMWTTITGGYTTGGWPAWQSGPTSCPAAGTLGFAGGPLWLVQHFANGSDVDIAC